MLKRQKIPPETVMLLSEILQNYGISMEEILADKQKTDDKEVERKWLTVAQAMKYTGVSRSTLGRWHKKGLLKQVCKLTPESRSGKILFLKSEIDLFMSTLTLQQNGK